MMVSYAIRFDDEFYHKLKVIAAYRRKSLMRLILDELGNTASDWEREHGEIEFPDA